MLTQIQGLHHVTSMASSAPDNNAFFTRVLGLRRVKQTVNFDAPDIYHLYYGDTDGAPGTVMTYFPFPHAKRGTRGAGEVGTTAFSIPPGTADAWATRLATFDVQNITKTTLFDDTRLHFDGPDGDHFALVETDDDRTPWTHGGISPDMAIRGFTGASLRLADTGATRELLTFMGYSVTDTTGDTTRLIRENGNAARTIDLTHTPSAPTSKYGAGSVHHIAFAVDNRARQLEVREALIDTGWAVTPVIDRDYFHAIYFRTPGGVLFEVATNEPGFDRDEPSQSLGQSLKLPSQHEHLRAKLERSLEPLDS